MINNYWRMLSIIALSISFSLNVFMALLLCNVYYGRVTPSAISHDDNLVNYGGTSGRVLNDPEQEEEDSLNVDENLRVDFIQEDSEYEDYRVLMLPQNLKDEFYLSQTFEIEPSLISDLELNENEAKNVQDALNDLYNNLKEMEKLHMQVIDEGDSGQFIRLRHNPDTVQVILQSFETSLSDSMTTDRAHLIRGVIQATKNVRYVSSYTRDIAILENPVKLNSGDFTIWGVEERLVTDEGVMLQRESQIFDQTRNAQNAKGLQGRYFHLFLENDKE